RSVDRDPHPIAPPLSGWPWTAGVNRESIQWLPSTSTCYKYLMVTITRPRIINGLRAKRIDAHQDDLFDPDCPTKLVLNRIGDKWTVLVILLLSDGPTRFSELRSHLARVAPKVLTQTLRRMERDDLVTRKVFAEVPP